jgi:uncharacterized protein with von Willebrand factor type A (vWA) domain
VGRSPFDAATIENDSYDRAAWRAAFAASERLQRAAQQGGRLLPRFDALLFDLYLALYKLNVLPRPRAAVPASALVHRRIVGDLMDAPGWAALRERTALDEPRAAAGAAKLAEEVTRALKQEELLDEEELLALFELAEEEGAIAELEEQEEAAEELASQLPPGGDEEERPIQRALQALREERRRRAAELRARGEEAEQAARALPQRLTGRLGAAAERLPDELDAAEAEADAFERGLGAGMRVPAEERLALGEQLAKSEKLQRLAALVGAMREEALDARRVRAERMAAEVYEVRLGNEVARLLPVELVALRHPLLRRDLLRRLAEGRALSYALKGARRGKGPIVCLVDVSSSMQGKKELWAKAVALTLMDVARRQGRRFQAVTFSAPPNEPRAFLPLGAYRGATGRREADASEVLALAEHFPGGGTDYVPPLDRALETLKTSAFRQGDLVFITDGEAALPAAWRASFLAAKAKLGFRLFVVLVDLGASSAQVFDGLADEVALVSQLTTRAARRIFERV